MLGKKLKGNKTEQPVSKHDKLNMAISRLERTTEQLVSLLAEIQGEPGQVIEPKAADLPTMSLSLVQTLIDAPQHIHTQCDKISDLVATLRGELFG